MGADAKATDLADILRGAGCDVSQRPFWKRHGHDPTPLTAIRGIVGHDTVTTPSWPVSRVLDLLYHGRDDLPGPIANLGLDRGGTYHVLAAGTAWHNGYGTWANASLGIEVFCAGALRGHEESWNDDQKAAFVVGCRAILDALGIRGDTWYPPVAGHKETDPQRKPDPWDVDMSAIRSRIRASVKPTPPAPRPAPTLEDVMIEVWTGKDPDGDEGVFLITRGVTEDGHAGRYTMATPEQARQYKDLGRRSDRPDILVSDGKAAPSWFTAGDLKRV